jgi:hypothetical protein
MAFARLFPIDATDAQDDDRTSSELSLSDGTCWDATALINRKPFFARRHPNRIQTFVISKHSSSVVLSQLEYLILNHAAAALAVTIPKNLV